MFMELLFSSRWNRVAPVHPEVTIMAAKNTDISSLSPGQTDRCAEIHLEERMTRLAERNPSWNIDPTDVKSIFLYFLTCKIFYLYDDEILN
jgi:hypothetical protein